MQRELKAENLALRSWSWQGPIKLPDEDGDGFELRIAELPDFFVAGTTKDEVLRQAYPALVAYLASYLARGEQLNAPPERGWWQVAVRTTTESEEHVIRAGHRLVLQTC